MKMIEILSSESICILYKLLKLNVQPDDGH